MRTGRPCRYTGRLHHAIPALLVAAAITAPGSAAAALIGGSYQLDYSQDVTKNATQGTNVRKFKQTLEIKYRGFLSPVLENEVKFKVESEFDSSAADTTRLLPTVDLAFKGRYWDAKAGVKRTHETSNDPMRHPKTTDNWYGEFFYKAPRRVPDLKAKYTLDTEFEETSIDTRKQGIDVSSLYKPTGWLEVKGEYSRDTNDDRLKKDNDTEDEKSLGVVGLRHMFSKAIKAEAEYSVELNRGATLLEAGGSTNPKEDQTHKVKSLVAFRPFVDTALDGTYDYELKQNKVNGEHTLTTNMKATVDQKIMKPITVKGEFFRVITEARHTIDDNTKTEDTWTVDLNAVFSKLLDFSLRHQDKHIVEEHVNVSKSLTNSTIIESATWEGQMTAFWKASASYDRTNTYLWDLIRMRETKTLVDTKYNVKSTLDFKNIKLTLDPSYDINTKDDRIKLQNTATREFKFKIAYVVFKTRTLEFKADHTYGRKQDGAAQNVQRTDMSNGNLLWTDPLPGWLVGVDLIRTATDTSGDDLPPDINSTFGFKVDYKHEWLSLNTSYKYDMKSLTDDSETFDAKIAWTAPRWDVQLTYNFNKVFSAVPDEKYSITLSFKYNL